MLPPVPSASLGPEPVSTRLLLVLEPGAAEAAALVTSLGLSAYEAEQRRRRGGFQLHRVLEPAAAEQERERLTGAGIPAFVVPEAEAALATTPRLAIGGRFDGARLHLRFGDGESVLAAGEAACFVQGPIAREYQTAENVRRVRAATLAEGYRIQVHALAAAPPIELDPAGFDFAGAEKRAGSSLLEMLGWVDALRGGAVADSGFARLPPALAPARADPTRDAATWLRGTQAAPGGGAGEGHVILDNLAQFRSYSGWRAAVARRLRR